MKLADRIQKRLATLKLSRLAAAKAAGLNATYIRDLVEERVRNPRADHLARLAAVLQTTSEWLLEGRGPESPSSAELELQRLNALLRRIAPEDLPQAERALRGFVRDEIQVPYQADAPPAKRAVRKRR